MIGWLSFLKAHKISVLSLYKTSPEPHFRLSIAHQKISATLPLRRPKIALLYPLGSANIGLSAKWHTVKWP